MPTALRLGLALLLLVGVWRLAGELAPRGPHALAGAEGGLTVLATAKGTLLPRARLAGGEETLDTAVLVGDATLCSNDVAPGLRVVRLAPSWNLVSSERLDVAGDPADLAQLEELAANPGPGTLLVLCNRGRISPGDPRATARLASVLEELGARGEPAAREPVSWALLTRREAAGWTSLAESVSSDTGVSLAYVLDRERRRPAPPARPYHARLEGRGEVRLDLELDSVEPGSARYQVALERVGPQTLPSLRLPAPTGGTGTRSVVWPAVALGEAPRFRGAIGLREDSRAGTDGAWFSIRIDGETVKREAWVPRADGLGVWRPWNVDLGSFAGRTVRFELVVEPGAHSRGDDALFGLPTLEFQGSTP